MMFFLFSMNHAKHVGKSIRIAENGEISVEVYWESSISRDLSK